MPDTPDPLGDLNLYALTRAAIAETLQKTRPCSRLRIDAIEAATVFLDMAQQANSHGSEDESGLVFLGGVVDMDDLDSEGDD